MTDRWRRFVLGEASRVRRGGRAAVLWSFRITAVATGSYVVAVLLFPGTQPLLAPLTAMVIIQVTPVSLLVSGLDRVVAVVAGVSLAAGFATVVPLEWWSLGLLLLVSITVGQFLRLRANLVEVGISAMLVLGVGSFGAPAAAWQRITETLVGAAVGVLANLVFPPKVASSDSGHAIDAIADSLSELLMRAATELDELPDQEVRDRLASASRVWLDDARRITRRIPLVDAELQRVEEARRLNVRAVRTPHVEPGLRQGLEALEHSALAVRSLMRAVADVSAGAWVDQPGRAATISELAQTFRQMAAGIDAFGELVRNEGDVQVELSRGDIARLREALDGLREAQARLGRLIDAGAAPEALELHAVERSTVRRLLGELDLEARVRRQLRQLRTRRRSSRPARRHERPELWAPAEPDEETQALPTAHDDDGS